MPTEWQARQLLLTTSAPGPSNMRSPNGRSTLTDLKLVMPSAATAADAVSVAASANREIRQSDFMPMAGFSRCDEVHGFNDIAHEACRIPGRLHRLCQPVAIRAPNHQGLLARARCYRGLPALEAVFALI